MYFCAVCGDKATKLRYSHYGAVSCFSCRTFFRRSVEKGQVFTCQWSSKCKIDRVTRRKCTACRFAKCKAVGMKHSTTSQIPTNVSTSAKLFQYIAMQDKNGTCTK